MDVDATHAMDNLRASPDHYLQHTGIELWDSYIGAMIRFGWVKGPKYVMDPDLRVFAGYGLTYTGLISAEDTSTVPGLITTCCVLLCFDFRRELLQHLVTFSSVCLCIQIMLTIEAPTVLLKVN